MQEQYVIKGTGSALPRRCLSNDQLIAERGLDSNNEWIVQMTGIRQRYLCGEGETTSTLAIEAARKALASAGISAAEVGVVIVATCTPDKNFPSVAAQIQGALGLPTHVAAMDVNAACGGFISALAVARGLLAGSAHTAALVVGAEAMSSVLDWSDRRTCILFGDGAGALVLKKEQGQGRGLLAWDLGTDGTMGPQLCTENGLLRMNGREVFKYAVREMGSAPVVLGDVALSDVDWLVPHQANLRILQSAAEALNVPFEKVVVTVDAHANTSGASIPLALDTAARDGRLQPGQKVLLQAFGAGFVWGSALLVW